MPDCCCSHYSATATTTNSININILPPQIPWHCHYHHYNAAVPYNTAAANTTVTITPISVYSCLEADKKKPLFPVPLPFLSFESFLEAKERWIGVALLCSAMSST